MNKIKSGIPGLDEILKGGILETSSILVSGGPGTGKSIFALQFALGGMNNKEPSLYITSEETKESLKEYALSLDIDLESYKNLFFIIEQGITGEKIFSLTEPIDLIKKKKIKRVVLDSLTFFRYVYAKNELEFRSGVLDFILKMRDLNVTLMVTSEKSSLDLDSMNFDAQDFLFRGLIILTKVRRGSSFERVMLVSKMRGQDHLLDAFPFLIKEGGITIFTKQLPFSLMSKDDEKKY